MTTAVRILVIEDNEELAADAVREIEEAFRDGDEFEVEVKSETDFDRGLAELKVGQYDLVVLDVRRDKSATQEEDRAAGLAGYRDMKQVCFTPVVFWTAVPQDVKEEELPPIVTVLRKEELQQLPTRIRAAIESGAAAAIRSIEQAVSDVMRRHMWDELAPNWAEYTADGDHEVVAQVLVSRLARTLEEDTKKEISSRPSQRYVYLPHDGRRRPGEIRRSATDLTWWVILTPACDLANNKSEFILLAQAKSIDSYTKYQEWITNDKSKAKWNELWRDILASTSGRYFYLPQFRDIPHLVIDLNDVRSVKSEEFDKRYHRVASLASPFSEALLVQHSHFRGRVGVPDLQPEAVKESLAQKH